MVIVDAAYTVLMQLLAICREGNNTWFCSSYVGHHIGMNMGWKHYSWIFRVCMHMQVNVFFMVLALHTLLKAKRHPIERKNDSTLKASTELGRLVLIEGSD